MSFGQSVIIFLHMPFCSSCAIWWSVHGSFTWWS